MLGVGAASAIALWAGILAGTTAFVAASASPPWAASRKAEAVERYHQFEVAVEAGRRVLFHRMERRK